jgi:hypothetical protein
MSTIPAFTGTASHGSLRSTDVIPAALDVLSTLDSDEYRHFQEAWPTAVVTSLITREDDGTATDSDCLAVEYLWEDLFDAINAVLPEGWYFGSIEGDASDFGVWQES